MILAQFVSYFYVPSLVFLAAVRIFCICSLHRLPVINDKRVFVRRALVNQLWCGLLADLVVTASRHAYVLGSGCLVWFLRSLEGYFFFVAVATMIFPAVSSAHTHGVLWHGIPWRVLKYFGVLCPLFGGVLIAVVAGQDSQASVIMLLQLQLTIILAATIIMILRCFSRAEYPELLSTQVAIIGCYFIPGQAIFFLSQLISSYPGAMLAFGSLAMGSSLLAAGRLLATRDFLRCSHHAQRSAAVGYSDELSLFFHDSAQVQTIHDLESVTELFFQKALKRRPLTVKLVVQYKALADETLFQVPSSCWSTSAPFFDALERRGQSGERIGDILAAMPFAARSELTLQNFYCPLRSYSSLLELFELFDAEIILRLIAGGTLVGYVLIGRCARVSGLYSVAQRDQMTMAANHIGGVLGTLARKSRECLVVQKRHIERELYMRHQELNCYRESFDTFCREYGEQQVGIIGYEEGTFGFGNAIARTLVGVDLNRERRHPVAREIERIVERVRMSGGPVTAIYEGPGHALLLEGCVPLSVGSYVISVQHIPRLRDVITSSTRLMEDAKEPYHRIWLDTTQVGRGVDAIIPGRGRELLSYKLALLRACLGGGPVLLSVPSGDLALTVRFLHEMSGHQRLHTLRGTDLLAYERAMPAVDRAQAIMRSFFAHKGVLLIEDVQLLDAGAQKELREFFELSMNEKIHGTGGWRTPSQNSRRVICSSALPVLLARVASGTFDRQLYEFLRSSTVTLPSPAGLSKSSLHEAVTAIARVLWPDAYSAALDSLAVILSQPPDSFTDLRQQIARTLVGVNVVSRCEGAQEQAFTGHVREKSEIERTLCQGKKALRDQKALSMLYATFKSDANIARALGVTATTVARWRRRQGLIPK